MHRTSTLPILAFASLVLVTGALPLCAQESPNSQPAYIVVKVPQAAQITVDGAKTQQMGELRRFVSPPLAPGKRFVYTFRATWKEGGKEVSREQMARVMAGQETMVDLRQEQASTTVAAPGTPEKVTQAKKQTKSDLNRTPDVIYVPTPQQVVDKMLEVAGVKKEDVVYDLGCGDGRIVVTAAKKYGTKARGFDIDPERIKESNENVKKNNVGDLVTIEREDIFTLDLTPASVVTLYLLPELNVKLMPQLRKLKPGSRIVSHDFDMKGAKPVKTLKVTSKEDDTEHTIYLWIVPWEKE